jgi:hypothetical protein
MICDSSITLAVVGGSQIRHFPNPELLVLMETQEPLSYRPLYAALIFM